MRPSVSWPQNDRVTPRALAELGKSQPGLCKEADRGQGPCVLGKQPATASHTEERKPGRS